MGNADDDFVEFMEQMDIDDDDTVICPHCRTQHFQETNTVGHRLFISHECPLCCNNSAVNYSLPCGHVYCSECFVKIGGLISDNIAAAVLGVATGATASDTAPAAASATTASATTASAIAATAAAATTTNISSEVAGAGAGTAAGRTWMFPHHSDMTYEKSKGRQLTPAWQRNKKQTYDRQVKLMALLTEQKLDNNALKDILFYIDERNDMPSSLLSTIGWGLRSEVFRERFENHYKIYMGKYLTHTFLSSTHEMYESCINSSQEYNYYLGKLYKTLRHLDWRDTLSDLIYRYNNNEYKDTSMNMNTSNKYYCMKGHHFVGKSKHWMYINTSYRKKCKDCVDCLPIEPRHLLNE